MLKGVFYTAIAKYSGIIISLGIGAILARLLTPEEFGVIALVTVFVAFFNLLGNLGLGPAIVQDKNLSYKDLRSIFSFSVILALLLSSLFFLSAGWISNFYEEPVLIPIVRILSLAILFNILKIVPSSLILKKLEFKRIGIINVSIQISSGLAAIFFAFQGFGYYALVFKSVIDGLLIYLIYFYLNPVKPIFSIELDPLKRIASFSIYQFGFNFINFFSRNLDNLLIGKYIGNSALGYYNKSYGLMMLPIGNLTNIITPVLHPVLSEHQDNKILIYNTYLRVITILAMLGFPLSIFLYFSAPELIILVYGKQWVQSIPVFQILAFTIGFQVCLSSSGSIFQAVNRTDLLFLSGIISAILMTSGIVYGVFVGGNIEAVGKGIVGAFIINFFQGFFLLFHYALNQSFYSFFRIIIVSIFNTFLLGFILYFFSTFEFKSDTINLLIKSVIFILFIGTSFLLTKVTREFLNQKFCKNSSFKIK